MSADSPATYFNRSESPDSLPVTQNPPDLAHTVPSSRATLTRFDTPSKSPLVPLCEFAGCFSSTYLKQRRFDIRIGILKTRMPFFKTVRESIMTKGLSSESRELRRHLLSHNSPDVAVSMAKSGYKDPVGLIIEMTDEAGKQLTYAALERQGMPRHEIPELIASYCKNAIPTFKAVVTFEIAMKVLPLTSDTAEQSLSAPRRPGVHWIVIVAGGGNSYAQVPVGTR